MAAPARSVQDLKTAVQAAVEREADEIIGLSQDIMDHPELGYAEVYASERVATWLGERGLDCRTGLAGTGVRASVRGQTGGPTIALLGELDAVHVPSHPLADRSTGAAPACGHHASLAAACAAATAVAQVAPDLTGNLTLMAVPAEEILPVAELERARSSNEIQLATGKSELIRSGEFDDVEMALMVHTGREGGPRFSVGDSLNGAIAIRGSFSGTAAHAGSSPWLGVDAVRAARLAMDAIEAQKETFPETEAVRIAMRLTQPDTALGATPAACRLDVLVRARSLATLDQAVQKVDRAMYAGAVALGAALERTSELIYAPHSSSDALDDVVEANATTVVGETAERDRGRHLGACSDIGDLSLLMPVTHPYASGASGHHHSPTFRVRDHRQAAVEPATYLAMAVIDLLADGAATAGRVLAASPPTMTREEYRALRARMSGTRMSWPKLTGGTDDDDPT